MCFRKWILHCNIRAHVSERMHSFVLCAAPGPLLAGPMLRCMRGYLAVVSLETFKFKHRPLTLDPCYVAVLDTKPLSRQEVALSITSQSRLPTGRRLNSPQLEPTGLPCASCMHIPEGRGGAGEQAAHSQHILPFLLNSWSLQRATITALVTKSRGMEDTGAAITVATMEQVGPLLQHQMSATAPSAGRMSADKNITCGGERNK